ncbi:MAG TPA: bifunctional riboflavin kinase/FAD synthetase [Actinomycetes bacterium]|nr:bifunctional riboflavin kinase/FAD synthetase [Actinomycetes bacterium]
MTARRFDGVAAVPRDLGPTVVTVGMFDGVHLGHRALLDRVAAEAAARGVPAAAVTFDRHPLAVLRPGSEPPLLTTLDRKVELLGEAGVEVVLVLAFTPELSQVGAEAFAADVLFDGLGARAVVVGENFRFGHKAAGDPDLLADLGRPRGIEVVAVGLHAHGGQVVSSTRVRAELAAGDVAAAAASLGRPYAVEGVVVAGNRRGGPVLGMPTANLDLPAGIAIPADGVYAGHLTDEADPRARPAAVSVGTNPQFGTERRRVEAHVLDFDGDLYGHRVAVGFSHRLRGQAVFAGVDELAAQMRADVDQARRLLSSPPGGTVRSGGFPRPTP